MKFSKTTYWLVAASALFLLLLLVLLLIRSVDLEPDASASISETEEVVDDRVDTALIDDGPIGEEGGGEEPDEGNLPGDDGTAQDDGTEQSEGDSLSLPRSEIARFDGSLAIIAGRAEPGAEILLHDGEAEIARGIADDGGQFALSFPYEPPEGGAALTLSSKSSEGERIADELITVLPQKGGDVAVARIGSGDVTIEQRSKGMVLALSGMSYGDSGPARLSGTGAPGAAVEIIIDGKSHGEAVPGADGRWSQEVEGLELGEHEVVLRMRGGAELHRTLRREAIGEGEIASTDANAPSAPLPPLRAEHGGRSYMVSRGDNLWRIAEEMLGKGIQYHDIFDLNTDQIDDPDLIYPGQALKIE